jgi:hypothetical protein
MFEQIKQFQMITEENIYLTGALKTNRPVINKLELIIFDNKEYFSFEKMRLFFAEKGFKQQNFNDKQEIRFVKLAETVVFYFCKKNLFYW